MQEIIKADEANQQAGFRPSPKNQKNINEADNHLPQESGGSATMSNTVYQEKKRKQDKILL